MMQRIPQQSSRPGQSDSVKWVRVDPRPETILPTGRSANVELDLIYVLSSEDRAFLTVYLEEFESTAGGCVGGIHQTNGATSLQAIRGEHYATLKVNWPGRLGNGFLAVGANFWKDVDEHPGDQIVAFGLFPELCYRFGS